MMQVSHLQQHQAHGVLTKLCLSTIFLLLSQLGSSPAFGQATYSDTWPDDSGVQSGTIYDEGAARSGPYADGCGVTDGAYTHSYYVDVTETSPSGRSIYRSGPRRVGYARADVTLLWNWDDSGEYVTDTQHWARCPYDELSYYSLGFTQIRLLFGASINVMA